MVTARQPIDPAAIRPLLRKEYDVLVAQGLFADEKVELIRGSIVRMVPQGPQHANTIRRLVRLLRRQAPDHVDIDIQLPIALSDDSEPEPDLAIVPHGDYTDDHPHTALLVVEVAVSSARTDRGVKGPLYADAGVPEFWLVDLEHQRVEVYTAPGPDGYTACHHATPGEQLTPAELPEITVAVADILP